MKDEHICRCEEVTREEIEKAMAEGATTLTGIKVRTRAGMGLCQGRTCRRLITQILSKENEPSEIYPPTSRPPVRAVKIGELTESEED